MLNVKLPAHWRFRLLALRRGKEGAARASGVRIGQGCRILSNVMTSEPWLIDIGDRVTVSSDVRFVTHDGSGWLVDDDRGRAWRYAPISIGNEVFIGAGSTLLPGVRIGDRCVVGAGSVVTKSVPNGSVVAGNPARVLGTYDELLKRMRAWPRSGDMVGATYRERVDSVVGRYRPVMRVDE